MLGNRDHVGFVATITGFGEFSKIFDFLRGSAKMPIEHDRTNSNHKLKVESRTDPRISPMVKLQIPLRRSSAGSR